MKNHFTNFDNGMSLEMDENGWAPKYRVHHGNFCTEWGSYEDIHYINGVVFLSPYYTGMEVWTFGTPDTALKYVAKCVKSKSNSNDDTTVVQEFKLTD